ncbi:efflux transporter periplasmic adaptor subunit [Mucilaginibacter sp. PPCGB 2223]|uniref:efflux RND transporter periplasmic adaptor subunit n=1 Tax=Mucilaginibacter sp. PPCGB 2223 TaxID=1886027 RepID=UPI000825B456|nr:efflux RND transporter periplasmic adaptor subunit [Mucilaginibacter sp. PPCGB 2223]OCX53611.1 efflux transporter periplasmic adaptor subunit [Mucilaginibacter sp. PPCGB 2223]
MKTKILLISAVALLAACTNKPKDPKAELADLKKQQADITQKISDLEAKIGTKDSVKSTDVSVTEITKGTFTNYVQLQGRIDAQDNVTAYAQAPGMITNLYVKAGDHVTKGQLLAQLDNSVLKQSMAQAMVNIGLLKTVYERQKNLWDQKIGTEIQFLQAQSNLQSAEKQLAVLKEQSDQYRIISPISGTVDQMDLKVGQSALMGIRIVNTDNLKVKADVPESYSNSVNQGQTVKVMFPDANDSLVTKVTFATKVIDPGSRSFGIEIKLPGNKKLRPNMTAIIKIADYSHANAVVIPLKAIQKSEQGDYVFVEVNGIAKRKPVKVGTTYGSQSEILSGLEPGDKLITEGASDIEDGDKVKVSK